MIVRLICILTAVILAPVISYLTGYITMRIDTSTEATVGVTCFKGFPVWFYEQAAGISLIGGWHPQRFILNTVSWFSFFLIVFWIVAVSRNKKRKAVGLRSFDDATSLSGDSEDVHCLSFEPNKRCCGHVDDCQPAHSRADSS